VNDKVKVPKNKINKLRKELAGRSLKPVASKLNVSEVAIYNVLNHKSYSERIIEACIDYRDELRCSTGALSARI
jgi:hypothetical protein